MRKPAPLTERQKDALELARQQGGKLYKNSIAWGPKDFDPKTTSSFGSLHAWATVRSLVTRNAMRWSAPGEVEVVA